MEYKREAGSRRDRLVEAVNEKVIDTVKSQMSKTDYFRRLDGDGNDDMKYATALLTINLGCELELSMLDHRIKVTGGSFFIQNLSRKNLLASGGLQVHPEFES